MPATDVPERWTQQLFTKAYEFFKAHKAKNMTYFVANEIASAHFEAGKFDMALKCVALHPEQASLVIAARGLTNHLAHAQVLRPHRQVVPPRRMARHPRLDPRARFPGGRALRGLGGGHPRRVRAARAE